MYIIEAQQQLTCGYILFHFVNIVKRFSEKNEKSTKRKEESNVRENKNKPEKYIEISSTVIGDNRNVAVLRADGGIHFTKYEK